MNKEWFILNNGYHQGPFSENELKEQLRNHKISLQTPIWSEGMINWMSVAELFKDELANESKKAAKVSNTAKPANKGSVPPIPKKVASPLESTIKMKSAGKEALKHDDLPPPIPLDAFFEEASATQSFESSLFGATETSKTNKKAYRFSWSKYLLVILLVGAFCTVLVWYSTNNPKNVQVRVKGVMPVYVDRLQEIVSMNSAMPVVGLALALDGKSMVAAINKPGDIKASFRLESVSGRVLGTKMTSMSFEGNIKNHVGEFKKLKFVQGNQFYPGEYKMHFEGITSHPLVGRFPFLKSIAFFKDMSTSFNYEDTVLLYQGTPKDFEKKINEFNEGVKEERLAPFTQRAEILKTVYSLLNKTTEKYVAILYKSSRPKDVSKFESDYIAEISPIIQSLMVSALEENKKLSQNTEADLQQVEFNNAIVLIGKNIGEMASDMITQTQELKTLTEMQKNSLRAKMEERYKSIKQQVIHEISQVDQDAKNIK